jgi:hypothetical protein
MYPTQDENVKRRNEMSNSMKRAKTKEGLIRQLAQIQVEIFQGDILPYYGTRKGYSNCSKWKKAISEESKKIRVQVKNKTSTIINDLFAKTL